MTNARSTRDMLAFDILFSTITLYAHEHYDYPTIDAMDYFWPRVAKLSINKNYHSFYTMEMETHSELRTSEARCNDNNEYSFSKERINQLCLMVEFHLSQIKEVSLTVCNGEDEQTLHGKGAVYK